MDRKRVTVIRIGPVISTTSLGRSLCNTVDYQRCFSFAQKYKPILLVSFDLIFSFEVDSS